MVQEYLLRVNSLPEVRIKLAAYVICKNEYDFILRCADSLMKCDYVVICDTGSTDGTWQKIQKLAKFINDPGYKHTYNSIPAHKSKTFPEVIIKQLHIDPWRFDDAKNAALALVPNDVDLCISIDADEILHPDFVSNLLKRAEKNSVTRYHHRFSTWWNWDHPLDVPNKSEHWHERVHARRGYRWKLPVHEILVHNGEETVEWCDDLWMYQHPDSSKSRTSYFELLKQSSREDPLIWKTWTFLAGEHEQRDEIDEAISCYQKAKILDSDQAFINHHLARLYLRQGNFSQARSHSYQSVSHSGGAIREWLIYHAQLLSQVGDKDEAASALHRALAITERTYGYEYNQACWDENFLEKLRREI